jgi:hypothetical protein
VKLSATQIGRAGEYYVCHLLEVAGIEVTRIDGQFDLLAVLPSGRLARIEVKTATRPSRGVSIYHKGGSACDFWALYSIEAGVVRIVSNDSQYVKEKVIRVPQGDFTEDLARQDIDALLAF